MGVEIERKYLVINDSWKPNVESQDQIAQGYLASSANATVRVRVKGDGAYLTIKGPTSGVSRSEYEYPIPVADAKDMLRDLALYPPIEKTRYLVPVGEHVWELDLFAGENTGLVMAEVELGSEDEEFEMPEWAGEEVSHDRRYYNSYLARHPYKHW